MANLTHQHGITLFIELLAVLMTPPLKCTLLSQEMFYHRMLFLLTFQREFLHLQRELSSLVLQREV